MTQAVQVNGLRELLRVTDRAGKDTKKLVRSEIREAAKPVLEDARRRLAPIDTRSAAKLGISVRRTGVVSVEQRARRTTGQHPEYGRLQMSRALIPALDAKQDEVVSRLEQSLDQLASRWAVGG